jgi:hypothetical protein
MGFLPGLEAASTQSAAWGGSAAGLARRCAIRPVPRNPCTSTPPRPPPSFTKLPRATNCGLSWRSRELGAAAAIYGGERTATAAGARRWCTRLGCGAVMGRLGDWGGPRLSFMAPRESAPRWVVEFDPHGRLPPWAASWLKQLTISGPRASE